MNIQFSYNGGDTSTLETPNSEGEYEYSLGGGTHLYSNQDVALDTIAIAGSELDTVTVRMIVRNNDPVILTCNGQVVSKDMSSYSLQVDHPFTYFNDVPFSFQGAGLTGTIDCTLSSAFNGVNAGYDNEYDGSQLVTSDNNMNVQYSVTAISS